MFYFVPHYKANLVSFDWHFFFLSVSAPILLGSGNLPHRHRKVTSCKPMMTWWCVWCFQSSQLPFFQKIEFKCLEGVIMSMITTAWKTETKQNKNLNLKSSLNLPIKLNPFGLSEPLLLYLETCGSKSWKWLPKLNLFTAHSEQWNKLLGNKVHSSDVQQSLAKRGNHTKPAILLMIQSGVRGSLHLGRLLSTCVYNKHAE